MQRFFHQTASFQHDLTFFATLQPCSLIICNNKWIRCSKFTRAWVPSRQRTPSHTSAGNRRKLQLFSRTVPFVPRKPNNFFIALQTTMGRRRKGKIIFRFSSGKEFTFHYLPFARQQLERIGGKTFMDYSRNSRWEEARMKYSGKCKIFICENHRRETNSSLLIFLKINLPRATLPS